ncbi:MAG: hypothetical protein QNJ12_23000 [Ilumatobacter sp.]|uniref:hypothetical protein n=1 Tax=Ilumatobacter sp. TaxID=1967498 RepID=UPI00262D4AA0|nr:hypothetical protein [Ilumatobacter sp.]MDJ0771673.1 hypothetical protein [Ilumatobacter sp.]
MFGFGRGRGPFGFPLFFLFVVLLAIVGFAVMGPAGAALGFLLFLPLKLFFFMFLFGIFFRFARGGAPWGGRRRGGPWAPPREPTREERERAEAERRAKEEVDSLFPDL